MPVAFECGVHKIMDIPGRDSAGNACAPLDICFVTREYLGFHKNGGIGTAVTAWAEALSGAGHRVTVLLTQDDPIEINPAAPPPPGNTPRLLPLPSSVHYISSNVVSTAHRVFTTLAEHSFDVVYFHDWGGQGYYSMLAKRQGLAFEKTLLCVVAHGSTPWVNEANQRVPEYVQELEAEFMERQSVELADVLITPSRYMLSWMTDYGWRLPARTYLLPYLTAPAFLPKAETHPKPAPPTEIVFFGRIEHRKGVTLFCDALDILARRNQADTAVTFLGRPARIGEEEAGEYLRRRASSWPFAWKILGDLDQREALAYLGSGQRLAVIPSLSDNSPNTVYECAAAAIPFLASDVGGIGDIISPGDRDRVLFPPRPDALARRLADALVQGVRPAEAAVTPDEARLAWLGWNVHLSLDRFWHVPVRSASDQPPAPMVSVCLTHHDRPDRLRQALNSLKGQDYPNFEVVLVDDGSALPQSHTMLDALESDFALRGWTIARQGNRYLGAARNAGAALAKGEYLLFMDDDNLAKPCEISVFVKAATATGADILTCVASFFETGGPAGTLQRSPLGHNVPLGGALGPGFFYNAFGDANALVKADVFHQLCGFTEERNIGFEDWEFFAKAVLAGYCLQVVPFVLFEYRSSPSGMLKTTSHYRNIRRALRPFLAECPRELAQALLLSRGVAEKLQAARNEINSLRQSLERSQARQTRPARPDEPANARSHCRPSGSPKGLFGVLGRLLGSSLPARAARRLRRERDARLLRDSPYFDAAWYLAANPDVAESGIDPAIHYLAHGAAEGRSPGPDFDSRFYLDTHKDVAEAGMNPLVHYIRHGRAEQRTLKAMKHAPPLFSPSAPNAPGAPNAADAARPHASGPARDNAAPEPGAQSPLVICPACDWAVSGVHTVTERIGKALRLLGWDFRILFTSESSRVLQSANGRLPELPHEFLPVDDLDDAAFAAALRDHLAGRAPCVLLCGCHFRANRVAAHLPQHIGVFVYSHSDEQAYYDQGFALRDFCHANICVSRAIEKKLRRMPGLAAKTHRIPNAGLHEDEVCFRSGWAEPELSCVYTGRLIQHQKRILDFIHLVRALEQTGRPYRLSLIGQDLDGSEALLRRELAEQIRQGRVRLPGRLGREDLLKELDQHNFFLLLSEFEGFSLSLAEAMGRGCVPVVASIESGNSEIVLSGRNGLVMPHRDYERWASWLCKTSQDEARWLRLSRAASETTLSSFTIERQAARVDALLRSWWKPGLPADSGTHRTR